jgi:FkbM family methyltransferase
MNYDQVQSIDESGEVFVWGHLEGNLSSKQKPILIDVGANIGEYSKKLSAKFPQSHIYSFEALPSTFAILEKNLSGIKNITSINKALGSKQEERTIFTDGPGSGLTSFYSFGKNQTESIVSVITLDQFCQEHQIKTIDFLKIDVEGFEMEVLKGAKKMIDSKKILNIQFEFGGNHLGGGNSFYEVYEFLSNYKISRVLKNGLRQYGNYSKHLEVQLSANYLAELKV